MGWMEYLNGLLTKVANAESGQVGSVLIHPPDSRVPVKLRAERGEISVEDETQVRRFAPDQAAAAVDAYCAAVEGYA